MKEKLTTTLGALGGVLWFILSALYCFSPLLILRLPGWLDFILFMAMFSLPFVGELVRAVLYIWALVVAIQGPQDVFAIVFYVIAAIYFFTTLVPFVAAFFKKPEE